MSLSFWDYITVTPFVVFFFGFCIFIHELGHFLAAKWRGLHIVAFSIGFKKIWGFKYKGVEYRIGCIPCGGYVDLPQIDATGDPKDENGNPLPPAKPVDKIITAAAGPLFNVLFGVFLSCFVWFYGIPQGTPRMNRITVAFVDEFSPEFKAGLREGDVITAFNGEPIDCTWSDFARKCIFSVGEVVLDVKRGGEKIEITYQPIPNLKRTPREKVPYPFFTPLLPVKCVVEPGSPAAKAGMRTGDVIIAVNGEQVKEIDDYEKFLRGNDGTPFNLTVARDGGKVELTGVKPETVKTGVYQIGVYFGESLDAVIRSVEPPSRSPKGSDGFKEGDVVLRVDGKVLESPFQLGVDIEKAKGAPLSFLVERGGRRKRVVKVFPTPGVKSVGTGRVAVEYARSRVVWCVRIIKDTPAEKAGLKAYDRILEIDGHENPSSKALVGIIARSKGSPLSLLIERDGERLRKTITPREKSIMSVGVGFHWVNHPTPWEQFKQVVSLTYKSLRGIFKGRLSVKHMSGPIGIFRGIAVTYVNGGLMRALSLIVMITYSLAILNIMPFPVLDGGHIVLSLIQWVFGKPLSPKIVQPLFVVFVVFLLSMMLYITFYDILRFIPVTKEYRYMNPPAEAEAEKPDL